jgi:hypothetical protein
MNDADIGTFARTNLEAIEDLYGGSAYRCSATLTDGLHLPCVLVSSAERLVTLAKERFEETRTDGLLPEVKRRLGFGMQYDDIIKTFVAGGNCINSYDIANLEKSRFAIPVARMKEIKGETSMSWTQFSAVMKDGREFFFGTAYLTEFFSMPEGYTADDIAVIHAHKGGAPVLRERPFFTCFVQGL